MCGVQKAYYLRQEGINRIAKNIVAFAKNVVTAVRQNLHRCNRRIR